MLLVLVVSTTLNAQTGNKKFLAQLKTEKTGVQGFVTFDGGTFRTGSFEDKSPNLDLGTKVELLSPKMIKDNTSWGLYHVKLKVLEGPQKGQVGYMYAASTSFSDYANYTAENLNMDKLKLDSRQPDEKFIGQIPTVVTGIKGTVTFDGGTLKLTSFADDGPSLKKGAVLELMGSKMMKSTDDIALHHIKVKVIDDKSSGMQNGKIGFMYPSSTSFSAFTDYGTSTIDLDRAKNAPVRSGNFIDYIKTEYTGTTGIVTFDGGTLKMTSFEDSDVTLKYGTKIELLSNNMIKGDDSWGLYHVKVKVIDDLEDGANNGKVGYMYPASTSFVEYADYAAERMNAPKGFVPDSEKKDDAAATGDVKGSFDLPDFTSERTGITGTVDGVLGDAWAYVDGSDWVTEVYLKEGAKFTLLNKKVFLDAITKFYFVKVQVTSDPSNTYTGKVMYVNVEETTLTTKLNKTTLTIE